MKCWPIKVRRREFKEILFWNFIYFEKRKRRFEFASDKVFTLSSFSEFRLKRVFILGQHLDELEQEIFD
jgi:hypothetical protein